MRRTIAAAVVLTLVAAVGVHAQEPQVSPFRIAPVAKPASSASPVKVTPAMPATAIFSKESIQKAIVFNPKMTVTALPAPAPAPRAPRSFKSFFKTPWPYIIGGAVAAGIIIAMNSGNDNGTGSGIY